MQPLYFFNIKPNIEISNSIEEMSMHKELKEAATPCFFGSPCNEANHRIDSKNPIMHFNIDRFDSFGGEDKRYNAIIK